jgi:hypothetical protein
MKRSSFLKMILSSGPLISLPFTSLAGLYRMRAGRGFMVESGKDRNNKSISLFEGDIFYAKVSPKDTDGDIYVFESTQLY